MTAWRLEPAGKPSEIALQGDSIRQPDSALPRQGAGLSEALQLLEAGCLRVTWAAFCAGAANVSPESPPNEDDTEWPAYLVSSLLWHLETKNLVREQQGELTLADTCDLPTVASLVRSLLSIHPTMAAEAAGLSRLGDIVHRLVAGDSAVRADLDSAHWRQLDIASEQISLLRTTVANELTSVLQNRKKGQLVRLLLAGAHHSAVIAQLFDRLSGIEVVITDLDPDRLEQARATLGDDAPHVRCVPWNELDAWPAAMFDLAGAIDALSEIAASGDGLQPLTSARPNAKCQQNRRQAYFGI